MKYIHGAAWGCDRTPGGMCNLINCCGGRGSCLMAQRGEFWGTAEVVKRNKRLQIRVLETGTLLYCPPDFVVMNGRDGLWVLARKFTELHRRDIKSIARFEYRNSARGRAALRNQRSSATL